MLKRLRCKFVCIFMSLVTFMLLAVSMVQLYTTYNHLEQRSREEMQHALKMEPFGEDADRKEPEPRADKEDQREKMKHEEDIFLLCLDAQGNLCRKGGEHFELPDEEELLALYHQADSSEKSSGLIYSYSLRYLKQVEDGEYVIAFADVSLELDTMESMMKNGLIIGLCLYVLFFLLSLFLARWAVKPVERAWQRQTQFVADASHELKTPLTVIMTNGELLREPCTEEQRQQYAENILAMSSQMRGLTQSLLDDAQSEGGSGGKHQEPVEYSQLAENVALSFEAMFFERGLTLSSRIQEGIRVKGCQSQLCQVIEILLDNAQKYSAEGSAVELKLKRGLCQCTLSVQSHGETLTKEQLERIFERFYRADQARTMNNSYGLGLSIAKSIVKAHRGRIWAQSKDGVNTFFVQLPTL